MKLINRNISSFSHATSVLFDHFYFYDFWLIPPRGVQFQCRDRKLDFLAKVATKIAQTAIWCSHLITQTQPKVILDQPKVYIYWSTGGRKSKAGILA